MAHTDNHRKRRSPRQRLRREVPSTVAVLADEEDFAAMRRYQSFTFEDHVSYLRHMDSLLRALAARGTYTSVALFDPVDFEEYCADLRLDPDTSASRTRYTAEVARGSTTVVYEGQPLSRLLSRLIDETEQQATWEYATELLTRGDCDSCGEDIGASSLARAAQAARCLVEALGTGTHHLVCSVPAEGATPLVALLHVECPADGRVLVREKEATVFCTVLAAAIATDRPGGVVARTRVPGGTDTVRGWSLRGGWPRPLSEAEVFSAYCTDVATGEPVPPEPDVEYRAGIALDPEHPEGS